MNVKFRATNLWLCLFLVVSIALVYWRVAGFGFVAFDDPFYVPNNPNVLDGLTWDSIKWAFTTMHGGNWIPLTWLSLMTDSEFFGTGATGFHLTNVALHIINTLLLFWVLTRHTKAVWPSFFVAAIFGLHPLHVESVAWVTERKDMLSTMFWMLTMLAYLRYVERPTVTRYVVIAVVYALGLMAKPMLVTLPFVLLIMDYWPLCRLWPSDGEKGVGVFKLVSEKAPLFVLSALSCLVTVIAQKSGGAVMKLSDASFIQRVGNAIISYCIYIWKMFLPVGLAVFYPHPKWRLLGWKVAVSAVVLLAITTVVILMRRRRYLAAGWLWYLGTLVPVIGLVQVGGQAFADRYTYIPLTGIFIMLVWLVNDVVGKRCQTGVVAGLAGSAILGAFGILTFIQTGYWRDTIALFSHTVSVTTNNYYMHSCLGIYLVKEGDIDAAMREFRTVLEIKPDDSSTRGRLGVLLAKQGDIDAAMREFEIVLKAKPDDAETIYNIGSVMTIQGRIDEAIEYYNRVLEIEQGRPDAYGALASIQALKGEFKQAMDLYRKGLEYNPDDGNLHGGLGSVLLQMGQVDEAIKELETAVKLKVDSQGYCNLGRALGLKGLTQKAIECYKKAIVMDPKNAEAHYNLGNVFLSQGDGLKAAGEFEKAIKARPDYAKAYGNMAIVLMQMGRIGEAVENFHLAVKFDPNSPDLRFNLANALAETSDIAGAIEQLSKVIELSPGDAAARVVLADLLLQQGQFGRAIAEYEEAIKIDPANGDASAGLQKARDMQKGESQPQK